MSCRKTSQKIRIVLKAHRVAHAPLSNPLLNRHQQILIAPAHQAELRIASHPDGMRRDDLEAVIKTRQIVSQDVFQQNEGVLSFLGGELNESRHDLTWNMNNGELGVWQR